MMLNIKSLVCLSLSVFSPNFGNRVSLNCTKLGTLTTKAYTGRTKLNSARHKLPPVAIGLCMMNCPDDWARQTCVGQHIYEQNFVSCTIALFGLGSFLKLIERDFRLTTKCLLSCQCWQFCIILENSNLWEYHCLNIGLSKMFMVFPNQHLSK